MWLCYDWAPNPPHTHITSFSYTIHIYCASARDHKDANPQPDNDWSQVKVSHLHCAVGYDKNASPISYS